MKIRKIAKNTIRFLSDADFRFYVKAKTGFYDNMPDEEYLKRMFKYQLGYELNLDDPQTFNEKLQWLKLHDRKPIYTTMVDKVEAKKFIAEQVGEQYVIPTLGVWDRFEDIDFSSLPDQFVLKTTHDSGGVVVCKDKSSLDIQAARRFLTKHFNKNFYLLYREWPYKDVKPRIMAEAFLDSGENTLKDYKFYTMNGTPRFFCINTNRGLDGGLKVSYFDLDCQELDFTWGFSHPESTPGFPAHLAKMVEIAKTLAKNTYQLRVDFYEVKDKVFLGELTLFDGGGFAPFQPNEWDDRFGSLLKLG